MRSLVLEAEKAGNVTIKELAALAEVQGCELHIQFIKTDEQKAKETAAQQTARKIGPAFKEVEER